MGSRFLQFDYLYHLHRDQNYLLAQSKTEGYCEFDKIVRVLMFQYRVNPECHVYFMGIHFFYTEFNEEFENLCPTFRHRQF